ncbi:CCA tRNA nucleotidyltransferase [Streptococcus entericus]|uniref:CCA tRNA nucleotidyltransferase n=1 Tax=Streptococcus entericus TaxID=155680 RepID=UPI00036B2A4B|nr:CCA tRNA nucleotidyltransferase [Streptococcus entericus]
MKLYTLPSEFQKALPILEKLQAAGYEAYFVGGSVRDALLDRPIHDVDIATSAYPQEVKSVFPRTVDIGIEHGTVLVLDGETGYEVTTFRTEDVYVDYRRPSGVTFVRSLEEDLLRRDFTVNAFALDSSGQVIDLFEGLADLDHRLLRAVGVPAERFQEDALRIMRGFRFAASLGFTLEPATFGAMAELVPLLAKISVERVFIEFDKLLTAPFWQAGLTSLIASCAYDFLPDMAEKGAALETLRDDFTEGYQFTSSEQAWAALLLALNIRDIKAFLKKWKTSNDFQKAVDQLVSAYSERLRAEPSRQLVYRYGKDCLLLVEDLRQAKGLSSQPALIQQLDEELPIHSKQDMAITGRDLIQDFGIKPGPQLGDILDELERAIVAGEVENKREQVWEWVKQARFKNQAEES